MNEETVYRRVVTANGRVRYVPAGRYWDSGIWPDGCHLVVMQPEMRSYRYRVDPNRAAVQAAIGEHREAVARVLVARTRESAWSVSDLIDTLISEVERLTAPADDGRCVEGEAWCLEPARATGPVRMVWPGICERTPWERADRVEPRGVVPVPSAWGPSTTATPTHGRCGAA